MSKVIAPIIIFTDNEMEQININENLSLRKITDEEMKEFFGVKVEFKEQLPSGIQKINNNHLWDDIPRGAVKIVGIDDILYPYFILESSSADEIEKFIYATRIVSNKTVISPKGISFNEEGHTINFFYPFNFEVQIFSSPKTKIHTITKENLQQINEAITTIHSTKLKNKDILKRRLQICLNIEQNEYIRFIECVGLLESILCGNDNGELSFRFSLYGSYVLQKLGFSVTSKDMKKFYNIRSKIVHTGNDKDYTREKLDEILLYTKVIYLDILKNNTTSKSILEDIEKNFIATGIE